MTATTDTTINTAPIDSKLIDRLRKILALTESPEEGEAASAAEMLQRFLVQYNLSVADLEQKGHKKAQVTEGAVDLGKAAFRWKLDLAEEIAEHYFCAGIVNRYRKTITFVGRPDNVESLKLLYGWVLDQIKRLAAEERKKYQAEHGEHMDPLRWQVNFGTGAGRRLVDRLEQRKKSQAGDRSSTALVLHHLKEISDYTEKKYNERFDGQETEKDLQRAAYWKKYYEERDAKAKIQAAADAEFLARDPKGYYERYPERHPEAVARAEREEQRRIDRNYRRRMNYQPRGYRRYSSGDWRKEEQADAALAHGKKAADRINLEPFVTGKAPAGNIGKGKGKGE